MLVNVYTGEEAVDNVKVNLSYQIGQQQLKEFNDGLPKSYHYKLLSNQKLMFTKATGLLSNSETDLETMMHCENSACDKWKCDIRRTEQRRSSLRKEHLLSLCWVCLNAVTFGWHQ